MAVFFPALAARNRVNGTIVLSQTYIFCLESVLTFLIVSHLYRTIPYFSIPLFPVYNLCPGCAGFFGFET
jgi:hypothetical protein